jgi:hypothetical protein
MRSRLLDRIPQARPGGTRSGDLEAGRQAVNWQAQGKCERRGRGQPGRRIRRDAGPASANREPDGIRAAFDQLTMAT